MTKFADPPTREELQRLGPDVRELPAGTELWRLYFRGGTHPGFWSEFRAFGPTTARFDHQLAPDPAPRRLRSGNTKPSRGIFYAALQGRTCLAEVFQESRRINPYVDSPWLVSFFLGRNVRLLDLTGHLPTRTGRASTVINNGPRPRAQRWSRATYEAYSEIEGLYYASAMDAGSPSVALYERAEDALPHHPNFHRSLADPSWFRALRNAAAEIGYAVDGPPPS